LNGLANNAKQFSIWKILLKIRADEIIHIRRQSA
jgi:hypothetical protein